LYALYHTAFCSFCLDSRSLRQVPGACLPVPVVQSRAHDLRMSFSEFIKRPFPCQLRDPGDIIPPFAPVSYSSHVEEAVNYGLPNIMGIRLEIFKRATPIWVAQESLHLPNDTTLLLVKPWLRLLGLFLAVGSAALSSRYAMTHMTSHH